MSTELISINPQLLGLKKEADEVLKAMEEFRKLRRLEPVYLVVNPKDWRAGITMGYCGLRVMTDPDVPKFKLSA